MKRGILYGVGVGPGDPELLTLKAVRILREADVVAMPDKGSGEQTEEAILCGVERLVSGCAQVVIVTNELFSDGMQYDPSTEHYLRILGRINCRLAQMADRVYEVVAGIAIPWKGEKQE